jgi:hypothetical protein
VVCPRASDCSPELVLGATSSWASGWALIGVRGRMVAWAQAAGEGETRGQNRGRSRLAGASGAHHGASSAHGKGKPPRGGFLRGYHEILWVRGRFPVRWQAHLVWQNHLNYSDSSALVIAI